VDSRRTDSRARFVHRIGLKDADGKPINLGDPKAPPYSPTQTCGTCHAAETISHGWHFNFTDSAVKPGRPGEPWIFVDPATRTQVPVSYRDWPGALKPEQFNLSPWLFTRTFGRQFPGGGPGIMTNTATPGVKGQTWKESGSLEIDCMICHDAGQNHDPTRRALQIEQENFKWAPTEAMGLAKISGSVKKHRDDPDNEDLPKTIYDKARADASGEVFFDVARMPAASKCYFCHTQIHVGERSEALWQRDGDVHLLSGLKCNDCHKTGLEHTDTRGYATEPAERGQPELLGLTCAGCHMGAGSHGAPVAGRLGSPTPRHKGIPTVHFEKLACTACHSGPWPDNKPLIVQTAMAHALGKERPNTFKREDVPRQLPMIVEPVFLRGPDGKIAPHRMVWPNYWGWMSASDQTVTPIPPEVVGKVAGNTLPKVKDVFERDDKGPKAAQPLADEVVVEVLRKLSAGGYTLNLSAKAPATQPTTMPTSGQSGKAVYISGGRIFSLTADKLAVSDDADAVAERYAKPYAWPLAHDVRPAAQSLGVRGCTDCHSTEGAIYFATVAAIGPINPQHALSKTNVELRGDSAAMQQLWALGFQGRTLMKTIIFICAAVLAAVLLAYGVKALGLALAHPRKS
jgi:hypothetical protein